jgi:hypothetical protein
MMPSLVNEDDIVLQFLDDGQLFVDDCENVSKEMTQYEALLVTEHNVTENECQVLYSSSPSAKHSIPHLLQRSFVYDIDSQSSTWCSLDEQQKLKVMKARHCSVPYDDDPISPSSSMKRMHSLAGNPLPQATTSFRAPPPSTLCPHALKHKFPEKYGDLVESDEEFLMRCLRQTSLDLLSRPADVKIYRQHSLSGYPLSEAYLDIPLGNSIYCSFEE